MDDLKTIIPTMFKDELERLENRGNLLNRLSSQTNYPQTKDVVSELGISLSILKGNKRWVAKYEPYPSSPDFEFFSDEVDFYLEVKRNNSTKDRVEEKLFEIEKQINGAIKSPKNIHISIYPGKTAAFLNVPTQKLCASILDNKALETDSYRIVISDIDSNSTKVTHNFGYELTGLTESAIKMIKKADTKKLTKRIPYLLFLDDIPPFTLEALANGKPTMYLKHNMVTGELVEVCGGITDKIFGRGDSKPPTYSKISGLVYLIRKNLKVLENPAAMVRLNDEIKKKIEE